MMTQATKTLLIIFISLLTLTALVKWTSNSGSSEAFRSKIVNIDTARVNKIRIEQPVEDRSIVLQETASGWTVAEAGEDKSYEADPQIVQRTLDRLAELDVQAVVTRDPKKFRRYKVDSTGTEVSLFNNETRLAGLVVGSSQFVSRTEFNNYVRPADEKSVYAVEGLLEGSVNRKLEEWREKQVWDLDRDAITRVDFLFPADSSYSIKKVGDQNWVSRNDTLKHSEISSIIRELSSFRASTFVDSLSVSDFGTELYAIQFQVKEGKQHTIRLRPDKSDDSRYISVASGYPYIFTLNRSTWNNSVLKPRQELLE